MPAPSLCVVSGTVFDENGVPAVGVTIYLTKVLLNGVLIGTAPIGSATIPGPSGDHHVQYIEAITSIAGGVVSFTVPQLSTVYLEGNVSGYNNGEIALSIPATATSTLEALSPATFPIDVTTFTFLSLVDTPDDFTGQALKNVRVNAAGTALEFAVPSGAVTAEEVQDALVNFFPDVAPFDWTYDDAGDRVTLDILDATAAARGLMSIAYAARLDALQTDDVVAFAGLDLTGNLRLLSDAGQIQLGASSNVVLNWDAADRFALRRGVNPQAQWIYNTFTNLTNYEAGFARWTSNVFELGTASLGTGTARSLRLVSRGATVLDFDSGGNLTTASSFITTGGSVVGRSSMMAFEGNASISMANNCPLNWSSTSTYGGSKNVGLIPAAGPVLKVTNGSSGSGAINILQVAGAVSDASFTVAPPDGTIALDSTNFKIYIRFGGAWKAVTLA